jgi:2-C-methyl-D-erythritol 4-phosphate cytidylyltransferase
MNGAKLSKIYLFSEKKYINFAANTHFSMKALIMLSGGVGSRLGCDIPKQYIEVGGKRIISYSLDTFMHRGDIDVFVTVVAEEWKTMVEQMFTSCRGKVLYAEPGETRQLSIYNALKVARDILSDDDVIIIHDAARPLVSNDIIDRCFDACLHHDGALPVIGVKDTLYMSQDGKAISSLLDRNTLYAGQAPESFVFGKYFAAHQSLSHEEVAAIKGSTEIAYKCGMNVTLVKGDEMNFKITTKDDLETFESIMNKR